MEETVYFDIGRITESVPKPTNSENANIEIYPMNEDVFELYEYLPVLYKNEIENEYLKTLFKALELSYINGLFQFAYIQLI